MCGMCRAEHPAGVTCTGCGEYFDDWGDWATHANDFACSSDPEYVEGRATLGGLQGNARPE